MSFQAYLDTIERKTGKSPRELLALAALFHVIKNGPKISAKHVGSTGTHRDDSDTLWLDGIATRPGR